MKVRTFMPLLAAALIAVLTLALGAGTGSAKTDVKAAPAPYKVALVTDIGGLDDRSFNFLANKGLPGEDKVQDPGSCVHLEVERRLRPEPDRRGAGWLQPRDLRRVPDGRRGRGGQALPEDEVRDHRQLGVAAELKGKPKNVRGLLFKEQEAGYLVGYLAGQEERREQLGRESRGRRRTEDPAGRPVHRRLLRGREGASRR